MEKSEEKPNEKRNGFTKLILKENLIVSVLDLSHKNLDNVDNIDFPPYLIELNISNNNLKWIPSAILNLRCLKILNISFNKIQFFDELPSFCHTIEVLNLAHNELCGPPYWVWTQFPKNLNELDISCNENIRKSLTTDYLAELLQYKTLLKTVKMHSCNFNGPYELLGTFAVAKILDISSQRNITANCVPEVPCKGLDKCHHIERLFLRHTYLATVNPNIDIYENLMEINLSENNVSYLPNEFCNLRNLEICILSFNSLMYLPDEIVKLKKLTTLCLDSNRLCMLPENMHELENLIKLDIYDNYLYEAPEFIDRIQEIDLAQNYLDEPDDEEYMNKKMKLRSELGMVTSSCRFDGRKLENERPESLYSSRSIDEELTDIECKSKSVDEINETADRPLSSPEEDWDSDEYWVPHFPRITSAPLYKTPWLFYVKMKMAEGNFCPMDAHPVPVIEKVRYEKLCDPDIFKEVDGQFDDYSSDDS